MKPRKLKPAPRTLTNVQRRALRERFKIEKHITRPPEERITMPLTDKMRKILSEEGKELLQYRSEPGTGIEEWKNSSADFARRNRTQHYRDLYDEETLTKAKRKAVKREFERNLKVLRHEIPKKLLEPEMQAIARHKLASLMRGPAAGRFENIGRVLSHLGKPQILHRAEAILFDSPREWIENFEHGFAPKEAGKSRRSSAYDHTDWGESFHLYNSIIFFEPRAFEGIRSYGWGFLPNPTPETALAIMVFTPDPKKLLEVTKAMAKRNPKNPIPILDIYGNAFYP